MKLQSKWRLTRLVKILSQKEEIITMLMPFEARKLSARATKDA